MTTHQIVIFKDDTDYNDYSVKILKETVTDWTIVTAEEFDILIKWCHQNGYTMLERVDTPEFVKKTVADYLAKAKQDKAAEEARKLAAQKKKDAAALKKRAKDESEEKRLLKELLEKHGGA